MHANLVIYSRWGETAFTEKGFNEWISALAKFQQYQNSSFHREYHHKLSVRNNPNVSPIDILLQREKNEEQLARRCGLLEKLKVLRIFSRQGIPLRNANEKEGNLQRFLQYSSKHCPRLKTLLSYSIIFQQMPNTLGRKIHIKCL